MTKKMVVLLQAVVLVASVPWLFSAGHPTHVLGLPPWAFYSFCVTVLYAVLLAAAIHRYWGLMAGDEDDN